jgi:hypothetical protein
MIVVRAVLNASILLATLYVAVVSVRWADREFLRVAGPFAPEPAGQKWLQTLDLPYQRFQHDLLWVGVAATVGMGAILLVDGRTWKRPARPARVAGLVSALAVLFTIANSLFAGLPISWTNGTCYGLGNALDFGVPGAVLGAWIVACLLPKARQSDWRDHGASLVGCLWATFIGLRIASGLLFG